MHTLPLEGPCAWTAEGDVAHFNGLLLAAACAIPAAMLLQYA